jgi:hypothetical protein
MSGTNTKIQIPSSKQYKNKENITNWNLIIGIWNFLQSGRT